MIEFEFYYAGEWRIAITYSGEHINGSPFPCLVYDSSQIFVHPSGQFCLNKEASFHVDSQKAGWGKLDMKLETLATGQTVPIKIDERGNGIYIVTFVPENVGKHLLHLTFNNQTIPSSPIPFHVDPLPSKYRHEPLQQKISLSGDKYHLAQIEQMAHFEMKGLVDVKRLTLQIKGNLTRVILMF